MTPSWSTDIELNVIEPGIDGSIVIDVVAVKSPILAVITAIPATLLAVKLAVAVPEIVIAFSVMETPGKSAEKETTVPLGTGDP